MKTVAEVHELKRQWLADPCWDIEETEGFEEHREELLSFRMAAEKRWEEQRLRRITQRAMDLRCSIELARYILELEERLAKLELKLG